MEFTVDDLEYTDEKRQPLMIIKMQIALAALEDGKLITNRRLAEIIGCSAQSLAAFTAHPAITDFKVQALFGGSRRNFFGNKITIEAYRATSGQQS